MNTSFSSPGFESNSNFYNPDWSNHSNFSWQAHATKNYAPQVDELHHPDYPQFDNQFSSHPSYDYPPKQSSFQETLKEFMELVGQPIIPASQEQSLEDTLKEFMQIVNQPCQEITNATVANTEAVARLEGQLSHLVAEFNIIEEEEFQSQEMVRSEEIFKETVNEPSLEYPTLEVQTEKGETTEISFPNSFSLVAEPFILDNHFSLPSSYDHPPQESLVQHFSTANFDDLEERANQLMAARRAHTQPPHTHAPHQSCEHCYHPSHQFDDCPFINHYVTEANKSAHENAQTTTKLVSEEKVVDKEEEKEEHVEQSEPLQNPSNDKEVSTEAHFFITIPLETYHAPQVSSFQCLDEPSYVEIFKDSRTQVHKSRNCVPKRIFRSKLLGYIRWRSILPEGYHILKKK
jgi:hypothetical protein